MGWNEPPGGNKGKDPWGGRGNGEGPPDLDELVKRMQKGFGDLFGRRPGGMGGNDRTLIYLVGVLIAVAFLIFDSTHVVDQQERGVVLRFGQYVRTLQPGLNFTFPSVIDKVIPVNVGQVRSITHKATMLTQDENIVDVEVAVQWRISDPAAWTFNVYSPLATLREVTESAVRQVIGKSKLDFVLTEGRAAIAQKQRDLMQKILDDYHSGIHVVKVVMQPAKPPDQVKAAFDDAIKAREDEQRLVNEAEAYSNTVIPKARGEAARVREEANAYKATVVAQAEGETARFEQMLAEYERAPAVTRQRLYLDALQSVMSRTGKVLLDTHGNSNVVYLPLDRLLERVRKPGGGSEQPGGDNGSSDSAGASSGTGHTRIQDDLRQRPER